MARGGELTTAMERRDVYATLLAEAGRGDAGVPEDALGWLHEAFHDEDRRDVFAGARSDGRKIDAGGVVAASRLYTPGHIVDFLLQNSLGAMWLEMHPDSRMADRWPFLVRDAVRPGRVPRALRDLRVLDPCCGCGAFLLAAADMLADLYAEERRLAADGRVPRDWTVAESETAATIVGRNLRGADLDAEAVAIATQLLVVRAQGAARPNLTVPELPLGSLDSSHWHDERFDIVATNPPYVGFRLLDPAVKAAVRDADPLARSDLALAFQSRCFALLRDGGICATVTPAAWLTGREALPLREHLLDHGGPRVTVALGQRVFDRAPLLFVGLSIVERGAMAGRVHTLRIPSGGGVDGLRQAVAAGADGVPRALICGLALRPFLPAAPPAVLALASRGPRLGDLFAAFDGVWTGSNARDTRYWWELPPDAPGWRPLSGGQGHEPWHAATRLRIRAEHAAGQPSRDGTIEYARVAGGRLAARLAAPGTASLAGIVTLVPRDAEAAERIEEVLAIFNSRVGTAWLRTLTSGLNFNPGYAAEIPLGATAPPQELRDAVKQLVTIRATVAAGDPTSDGFIDTVPPWEPQTWPGEIARREMEVETMLAEHLGIPRGSLAALEPVRRPLRRIDPLDDHLGARALSLLGMGWPRNDALSADGLAAGGAIRAGRLAQRLAAMLDRDGAPDPHIDLEEWVERRFIAHHTTRFRRRPIAERLESPARYRLIRG